MDSATWSAGDPGPDSLMALDVVVGFMGTEKLMTAENASGTSYTRAGIVTFVSPMVMEVMERLPRVVLNAMDCAVNFFPLADSNASDNSIV